MSVENVPMGPHERERLFQELEDGLISRENRDRLGNMLRAHAGTREAYYEHMLFAAALHSEAAARHSLMGEDSWTGNGGSSKRLIYQSVFAAAAIIAIVAVALSLFAVTISPVATVEASEGAEWSFEAGGIAENSDFIKDSRLNVDHGTVRLEFSSGTTAYVAAPATLLIRNRKELELTEGRAWFEVEKGDEGFSVTTETLVAVDLGTEFGVEAGVNHAQVHVLKGRVRVESRLPLQATWEIGSQEAVASDAVGYLSKAKFNGAKFPKGIKTRKKIAYWSFDGSRPMEGLTSTGERAVLSAAALSGKSDASFSEGARGRALDLTREGVYAASDYHCPLGSSPRTVAFWLRKPDGKNLNGAAHGWRHPPVLGWGDTASQYAKWHLSLENDGGTLGTVWGNAWKVSHLPESDNLFDGKWHHLVSVYAGREPGGRQQILHYVDGVRIAVGAESEEAMIRTSPSRERDRQLLIGYYDYDEFPPATLPIQIDELVIADFALSEQSILALSRGEKFNLETESE